MPIILPVMIVPIVSIVIKDRALTACGFVVVMPVHLHVMIIAVLWEGAITWVHTVVMIVMIVQAHVIWGRFLPYIMDVAVMPYIPARTGNTELIITISITDTYDTACIIITTDAPNSIATHGTTCIIITCRCPVLRSLHPLQPYHSAQP